MVVYSEDHPTKTMEKLNLQRLTPAFTDVTVTASERRFFLHKSLLAAHSSLFCSVLHNITPCQTVPSINLDGIDPDYFATIIEYIYTSKLDVTSENVDQILLTSQLLQVQDVIDHCLQFKENEVLKSSLKESDCFPNIPLEQTNQNVDEKSVTETLSDTEHTPDVVANQNANMMVEVYGDQEDQSLISQSQTEPSTSEGTKKTNRRGRKPQARISCEFCHKTFTKPKYEVHKRQHTGEKPFQCSVCNKRFVSIYNLRIHERIHTGERPYPCKFCEKTFADPSTVGKHLLWHAGVRNKRCDICGKFFFSKTQVREHQRSHTKEKPYSCPECGKSYGYRCDLKRHLREHTGNMFGPCKYCWKYFNHRNNFLTHMKTHKATEMNVQICEGVLVLPTQEGGGDEEQVVLKDSRLSVENEPLAPEMKGHDIVLDESNVNPGDVIMLVQQTQNLEMQLPADQTTAIQASRNDDVDKESAT